MSCAPSSRTSPTTPSSSVASYTLIGVGPWRDYLLVPIVPDPEDDWMEEAGVVGIVFGAQTLEAVEAFLRTYKVEAAPKAMDSPS